MMKPLLARRNRLQVSGAMLVGAAVLGAAIAALGAGCSVDAPGSLGTTSGSSSQTSGGSGGAGGEDAGLTNGGEALFRALEDDFVKACAGCHDAGGIANTPFLAGPDRYQTVLSWPGIVVKSYTTSDLLTHAVSGGGHSGTNLDAESLKDTLLPAIEAWLAEEANGIAEPVEDAGPSIAPFTPILGFNAVYLDALGADLEGMALTFTAEELSDSTLLLREMEVHPTAKLGVHMVHPLFVVYPKGGAADPDPVDSFSNLDQTFEAGQSDLLGPGTVIFTNWESKAKLSVAFEVIETLSDGTVDGGDGGVTGGCKDVTSFQDNAAGPLATCKTCHGGGNGQATSAVDMSKLGSDDDAACAQVLNRVSPSDPPSSQLFITSDPNGNAAHPYKFNGDGQAFQNFKNSVSTWVTAEQ